MAVGVTRESTFGTVSSLVKSLCGNQLPFFGLRWKDLPAAQVSQAVVKVSISALHLNEKPHRDVAFL